MHAFLHALTISIYDSFRSKVLNNKSLLIQIGLLVLNMFIAFVSWTLSDVVSYHETKRGSLEIFQ